MLLLMMLHVVPSVLKTSMVAGALSPLEVITTRMPPTTAGVAARKIFATAIHSTDDDKDEPTYTSTTTNIEWCPIRIELEGVYKSYGPPSLWRQLTSSVPHREFALQDLTVAFGKTTLEGNNSSERSGAANNENALCLLLGASSSGKSTLFRCILDPKNSNGPNDRGCIRRHILSMQGSPLTCTPFADPILLDDRRDVNKSYSGKTTRVGEAWKDTVKEALQSLNAFNFIEDLGLMEIETRNDLTVSLVRRLSESIFDLDPEALLVDLSPSERYRFCLGKACIRSSVVGARIVVSEDDNSSSCFYLPGPVILLDECMDIETNTVVRKVQPSLHRIVQDLNGEVVSITHKPELYSTTGDDDSSTTVRKITLSAGKLLSEL